MDLATIIDGADRFVAYVEELTSVIGHADRALPLRDYCAGLLTAEGRKSVEPMAAVTAPARVSVQSPTASSAEARSELLLMLLNFLTAAAVAICRRRATTA